MAPSTTSRMAFHRQLASVDLNTRSTQKPFEAYSLLRQVKLKQKRLISNQFHKVFDIHDEKCSGLSKGYPSTDVTGAPSESNQAKSSSTQSPSLNRKNRKSNPQILVTQKQPKFHIQISHKNSPKDPLEPIRSDIDPKFNLEDKSTFKEDYRFKQPSEEPEILLESLLHLSLSLINHDIQVDKLEQDHVEVPTTIQVSLCSNKLDNRSSNDFGPLEEPEIPEEFLQVELSIINPDEGISAELQFDSMEALLLPNLDLHLSLSRIQFQDQSNELSELSLANDLNLPNIDLSDIQVENRLEDYSELEAINVLLSKNVSIDIELSTVQRNEAISNRSDLEVLEALNILEA